jgi:cyclopropane fatty-acyl-phospholipid synthase-like methyltransferase
MAPGARSIHPTRSGFVMAARADIEFTYSSIDRIFRLSMGELADFSGAKYDGDFSMTLEQAQSRKHQYIAEQLGFESGQLYSISERLGSAA